MRRSSTYVILLAFFLLISCKESTSNPGQERGFDLSRLDELNASDRFNYDQVIEPSSNIILEGLFQLISLIAQLFNYFLGYMIIAILLGVLIWIIIRQAKIPVKTDNPENGELLYHSDEDIMTIDYSRLLQKALREGDHRAAIRYRFLTILQELQLNNLIKWQKDKTNYDYYIELPQALKSEFQFLVRIYEHIWYGDFKASDSLYHQVESISSSLKRSISR